MLEFTNRTIGTVEVLQKISLTESDIETIMVNGIEGGIGYWASIIKDEERWGDKPKDEPVSTWATKLLLDGKSVVFEADDTRHSLSLSKLLKGYRMNCEQRPFDCNVDEGDAITVDCIIQYALFDEVVYS